MIKNSFIKCLHFISLFIIVSCSGTNSNQGNSITDLNKKVNAYSKAQTNNPELYKPISISEKALVHEPLLIEECYYNKYAPKGIDFEKPNTFKSPKAKDIKEKFYSVLNTFHAQNKFGAIIKYSMLVYLDSSDNIISSITF